MQANGGAITPYTQRTNPVFDQHAEQLTWATSLATGTLLSEH